jgi:acetyl-CoA carboxylase carboxyltransferase component
MDKGHAVQDVLAPMIGTVVSVNVRAGDEAGGSMKVPLATVAWPTGEFGGMGLEGAVKLGFGKELAAIADPVQRQATVDGMIAFAYEHGKALNAASMFEIDDVIDPVDTRKWITATLADAPPAPLHSKRRPHIDTW